MTVKKEMNEIRPARGVKIKKKTPPLEQSFRTQKPHVIQNVFEDKNMQELPYPSDEALYIESQLNIANKELIDSMRTFNKLLNDQTLPENKSSKEKEYEQTIVNKLASNALSVENLSPNQGLLGLAILTIRQILSLRDAGNFLAYKLQQIESKIQSIEDKISTTTADTYDSKKEYLKNLAEQMGIKIAF